MKKGLYLSIIMNYKLWRNSNMKKQVIEEAVTICNKVADALNLKNSGKPYCETYCPGENTLMNVLNKLVLEIKDIEPECFWRLNHELQRLRAPHCLNPSTFSAVVAIVSILKMKYIDNRKKVFISHSSKDVDILEEFVDKILGLGIGINANDIFCSSIEGMDIKNGEDLRRHIQSNIRGADFSYLMISEHYKQSEICLNEMGAVWAYDSNVRIYMLPGADIDNIGWLCDTRKGDFLNDSIVLDEIKRELCGYYSLPDRGKTWSRQRELFCSYLNKL